MNRNRRQQHVAVVQKIEIDTTHRSVLSQLQRSGIFVEDKSTQS